MAVASCPLPGMLGLSLVIIKRVPWFDFEIIRASYGAWIGLWERILADNAEAEFIVAGRREASEDGASY